MVFTLYTFIQVVYAWAKTPLSLLGKVGLEGNKNNLTKKAFYMSTMQECAIPPLEVSPLDFFYFHI